MSATLPIELRQLGRSELTVPRMALGRRLGVDSVDLYLAHEFDPRVTQVVIGPGRPEHLAPVQEALERPLSVAERNEVRRC